MCVGEKKRKTEEREKMNIENENKRKERKEVRKKEIKIYRYRGKYQDERKKDRSGRWKKQETERKVYFKLLAPEFYI